MDECDVHMWCKVQNKNKHQKLNLVAFIGPIDQKQIETNVLCSENSIVIHSYIRVCVCDAISTFGDFWAIFRKLCVVCVWKTVKGDRAFIRARKKLLYEWYGNSTFNNENK